MTFGEQAIQMTIEKLVQGEDYRDFIIKDINAKFLDFSIDFFKKIVKAKMNDVSINLKWYKNTFLNIDNLTTDEIAIYAGMNKKSIKNIAGNAQKNTVIEFANNNFDYLMSIISELEKDVTDKLNITITLTHNQVNVELNLTESLIVINALATKKIALRGGAWSSIGKQVEKPLLDKLCELVGVPSCHIDNKNFKKDIKKSVDREVDYKLISKTNKIYRVEVKLMGKGNPESADVIYARDTNIFIADTLSNQNKNQFEKNDICFLELKGHSKDEILSNFKKILRKLDIPFTT